MSHEPGRRWFERFLSTTTESSQLLSSNLNRAAELIESFKQVAVDQSTEEKRTFAVKAYLDDILFSLRPKLNQAQHEIEIECDENLTLDSYPGAFSQIVTNLVDNSLTHAYQEGESGHLTFDIKQEDEQVVFRYSDDGLGITQENMSLIFNPFFTTRRGAGEAVWGYTLFTTW